MKKTLFLLATAVLTLFASCESHENDAKYRSMYPILADMEFESLVTGTDKIVAGEPFVARIKQAQLGRLLNKTTYKWSDGREEGTHSHFPSTIVYDVNPINPTDTIVLPYSGRQQIKMVAQYNISGGCDQFAANIIDIPEGKVNYEVPSFLYYRVTITKNLYVHPAPEQ